MVTAGIGHLDDANCITIYLSTGTNVLSSAVTIEVSQFDPADGTFDVQQVKYPGRVQSSAWYPILVGSSFTLSSGAIAVTISPVGFRGLRLRTSANSITTGTTIAFATKQLYLS